MSLKNDPRDCYQRAYDDEPLFTLRATDPCMAGIIGVWVADRLLREFAAGRLVHPDPRYQAKLMEALECGGDASEWWQKNPARRNNEIGGP